MGYRAIKVLVPAAVAAALLAHGAIAQAHAAAPIGLTDVTPGAAASAQCAAPARDSVCAPLFDGTASLFPGGPAQVRQVRITYTGDRPAHAVGLYVTGFQSRAAGSLGYCTAPDPASMLDVTVSEAGRPVYEGTLSALAAAHGSSPDLVALPGRWAGEGHTYTISARLDPAAGNPYMGCTSTADFVWFAEQ